MEQNTFSKISEIIKCMDRESLTELLEVVSKKLGSSDKFKWAVNWEVFKYKTDDFLKNGENASPYEVSVATENMVLDGGAKLLWDLAIAKSGTTPLDASNAYLYVGKSSQAEAATQNGVLSEIGYAPMDATFPQVENRTLIAQGTFGDTVANDVWNEVSLCNGNGSNKIGLNRKVNYLGAKAAGTTWVLKLTISNLVSA